MGKKWGKPNERPESRPKAFVSGWSAQQEKPLPSASAGRADEANWGGHKYDQKTKDPWTNV
jgi:hypothetical protein